MKKKHILTRWGCGLFFGFAVASQAAGDLKETREQLLSLPSDAASLPSFEEGMRNANPLLRRAAARGLSELGSPGVPALRAAFQNDADPLVRRTALRGLCASLSAEESLAVLKIASEDTDEVVRLGAVEILIGRSGTPAVGDLLRTIQKRASTPVSQRIAEALWPFRGDVRSARDTPEHQDIQLNVQETISLVEKEWKIRVDPSQDRHEHQWFAEDLEEKEWSPVRIGQPWSASGVRHQGVAWYRCRFDLPEKPPQDGTDLIFEAVDESAWIWINGQYAGKHDIGKEGWNARFAVDASALLRWGGSNQLTVRVLKHEGQHAGIWKPVYLEVLKK